MDYFFRIFNNMPTTIIEIPIDIIWIPYVIHSGLAYMNDDSGPIIDWPCKSKISPKMKIMPPITIIENPFPMTISSNFH